MSDYAGSPLQPPADEHRRIAVENYERARQVIQAGNHDYAIQLLMTCCKIDPANMLYRQTLRKTQKAKYEDNMRGSRFASIRNSKTRARLKMSKSSRDYLRVLECGEEILSRNPWDVGALMDMGQAFEALGLHDLAIYSLDQARHKDPRDVTVNRALARLLEKQGRFTDAIKLWQLIRDQDPKDVEAAHKAKDLAASETIQRGGYKNPGEDGDSDAEEDIPDPPAPARPAMDRVSREAQPLLERIERNPTATGAYIELSELYRRYGRNDQARAVLQQGSEATGKSAEIVLELMELDLDPFRRNLKSTDQRLQKLKERPEDDDEEQTEEELIRIRHKLMKEINAREIEFYRTKADRNPGDCASHLELGVRLLRAERLDEAIVELQQARRDERHLGRAAMYLGFCFRERNNWKLAKRNFEEALEKLPRTEEGSRKEVLFHLASGHADASDFEQAVELGNELANLDFAFRDIGRLIDEWESKQEEV